MTSLMQKIGSISKLNLFLASIVPNAFWLFAIKAEYIDIELLLCVGVLIHLSVVSLCLIHLYVKTGKLIYSLLLLPILAIIIPYSSFVYVVIFSLFDYFKTRVMS